MRCKPVVLLGPLVPRGQYNVGFAAQVWAPIRSARDCLVWIALDRRPGFLAGLAMAAMVSFNTPADGQAVSALNGKVDMRGGISSGTGAAFTSGSISIPLAGLGLQLDGAFGKREPRTIAGGGVHLFWRDPEQGLAGILAERASIGSHFINRVGFESEYYKRGWTLSAGAGFQNGFVPNSAYSKLDLSLYLTDNFMIRPGIRTSAGRQFATAGVEWQPTFVAAVPGLALFAEGAVGTHDANFALAGVRVYFGADKSLKRRHREDDPVNSVGQDILDSAGFLNQSSPNSSTSSASAPPPPVPPPGFF